MAHLWERSLEPGSAGPPARPRGLIAGSEAGVPAPASGPALAPADNGSETLAGYWRLLRRQKYLILACTLAAVLLAWTYSLLQTPIYQAETSLEYQSPTDGLAGFRDRGAAPAGSDPADAGVDVNLKTDIEVLQDEAVVGRAIDRLKLADRAEFNGASSLDKLGALLGFGSDTRPVRERLFKTVLTHLMVSNRARVISISFESADPFLAAQFANVLAEEFMREHQRARSEAAQRVGTWLSEQAADLRGTLEASEQNLQQYAQKTGLLFTGDKDSVAEERLRVVANDLAAAQADRILKQSQYEASRAVPAESLPQIVSDNALRDYEVKLTDLRRELEALQSLLTPSHYKVQNVQSQIAVLEAARQSQLAAIRRRLENEYRAAVAREQLLASRYAQQSQLVSNLNVKSIHYNTLKRQVETARSLEAGLSQRGQELKLAAAVPTSNIRVLHAAQPPTWPRKPNFRLNLSAALVGGLFLGIGVALLREHGDVTFRAPGEAMSLLRLPELAPIPAARLSGLNGFGSRLPLASSSRLRVELAVRDRVCCQLAESFHNAAASLCIRYDETLQVVTLTSPGPGEGKTTVAANLAIALAHTNRRVLLIDGDIRRPRLHKIFEVPNAAGLSDLLCESGPVAALAAERIVSVRGIPNLFLLPSGRPTMNVRGPGSAGVAALLHSERWPELAVHLRREFDLLLVDAPPALQTPDARLLSRIADGVIVVLRARKTSRDATVATLQRLLGDNIPILGVILNDWDLKTDSFYGSPSYYGARKV